MTDEIARVQSKQIGNNVHVNLSFFSEDPKLLDRVDAFLGAMLELYKTRQILPNTRIDELIKANSELVTNSRVDKATVEHLRLLLDDLPALKKIYETVTGETDSDLNYENTQEEKEAHDRLKVLFFAFIDEAVNRAKKQYDVKNN